MILEHIFSLWGMIIVGIICSMLGGVIGVIAKQWRKAREAEMEASLKVELIKQGRSAEPPTETKHKPRQPRHAALQRVTGWRTGRAGLFVGRCSGRDLL